ncbi:MAG: FMN-binding protein [bacterium]|nr:FMN-binding protein [bacterium]
MKRLRVIFTGILPVLSLSLTGCRSAVVTGGPVDGSRLADGVFRGECKAGPNKAVVEVTIRDQNITQVNLLQSDAWKGHKADAVIPGRIVEKQSTAVDAVSGATNTSNVIMNAVEAALVVSREQAGKDTGK